jgi:hypothetical protein
LEAKEDLGPDIQFCLNDWTNATYPCDAPTWRRVCSDGCSNGLVTKLCLTGCGFTGVLPTTWGTLPGMEGVTDIYMPDNPNLAGPLPDSWSRLTSLQKLHLESNKLNGTLPASWGNLPALQELRLYGNQLSGPLPPSWGDLTRLTWLEVFNNQLTGQLPERWGNMSALGILFLSRNTALTGTLPCSWKGMVSMERLYLARTNLTGCFPSERLEQASIFAGDNPNVQGVRGE